MLTLQVKEKQIENLTPEEEFIRGTVGAECQIDLDEFWQGYENTVVFKRENDCTVYNVVIDSLSNRVEIPYTVLAEKGSFKVGLFGVKPDEVLPTLWSNYIKVRYGTDTHGTTPPQYEPSEIDQLRLSKQDKLTAGDGITIDENNVISATGGGGSGGTTNYEMLENKPQINGVELVGNKSLTDLGIDMTSIQDEIRGIGSALNSVESQVNQLTADTYTKEEVDEKTVVDQTYDKNSQNAQSGTAVAEALSKISGGGETWEVISDTTAEFNTPVSQIVINQDTNGNSFSLKKMRVFIDFTVSEAYSGGFARALTASSGLMYIVSQSFSAGTVYGYFIDSEVLPMVNNRCQIISHFNGNRMSENGNNFNFEYNSGAVDYAIRNQMVSTTLLGYNVSSISNLDFRLGSAGKINKARILIFGVRA